MFTTLIDALTLREYLDDPDLVVVDCSFDLSEPAAGMRQYVQGHIPKAIYFHLEDDLSAQRSSAINGGRHPLPSRENACAHFAKRGIGNHVQVVTYDRSGGIFAARLWWMLRWIGHDAVAVLNGGLPAWQRMNFPLQGGHVHHVQREATHLTLKESLVEYISVETVTRNIHSRLRTLIDARSPDRFEGKNETIDPVAGHIPGAVNRFFQNSLNADGTFKGGMSLRREFEQLTRGKLAIHHCGSGVTACHNILTMTHAGLSAGGLFAGGWSEWIEDSYRPVVLQK